MKPSQYLKVMEYQGFCSVDFISPSVGMTVATGTVEEMEEKKRQLCALSDDDFNACLITPYEMRKELATIN